MTVKDCLTRQMTTLIAKLKAGNFMVDGRIGSNAIYHYFDGNIYTQYKVLSEDEFKEKFYYNVIYFQPYLPARNIKRRDLRRFHEETNPENWVKYCRGFYPYTFVYTMNDVWDLIQNSHSLITIITSKKDMDTGIVARLKNLYGIITTEDFNYHDIPIYRTRTILIHEIHEPIEIVDKPVVKTPQQTRNIPFSIITASEVVMVINGNSISVIKSRRTEDFFIEYVK